MRISALASREPVYARADAPHRRSPANVSKALENLAHPHPLEPSPRLPSRFDDEFRPKASRDRLKASTHLGLPMQYWKHSMKADAAMTDDPLSLSARSRFRTAMILAIIADTLQIIVFPAFAEGALSPADD